MSNKIYFITWKKKQTLYDVCSKTYGNKSDRNIVYLDLKRKKKEEYCL